MRGSFSNLFVFCISFTGDHILFLFSIDHCTVMESGFDKGNWFIKLMKT